MEKNQDNIWYLAGPMFQYNEDVKALARQAGLKIVDATVAVDRVNAAEDVPEVTIKAGYAERLNVDQVPTVAELLAARDQLLERERELAAEKDRLDEQAKVNAAEAQRLRDEAECLQVAKDAVAVAQERATSTLAANLTEKSPKASKSA